ncbi:MAG: hypothetical protein UCN61_06365 [Ruminococcus sp.]|nr:hypothetical protein [Ruminococcus sp.]
MQEILTDTSASDAAISTHFVGSKVAVSSPMPKQTADFILCL